MKRSRFNEEQIIGILKKHQAGLSVSAHFSAPFYDAKDVGCSVPVNEVATLATW